MYLVSWNEVQEFIARLNASDATCDYRLPTKAEWEYVARAGTETDYYFGDDPKELDEHAWYIDNADYSTLPVRRKKPNPWGPYDMHGNVWEWVSDRYARYRRGERTDPTGPGSGVDRSMRGGSWAIPRRAPTGHQQPRIAEARAEASGWCGREGEEGHAAMRHRRECSSGSIGFLASTTNTGYRTHCAWA